MIDRTGENRIFYDLSELHFSPKMYGTFENGRVEQVAPFIRRGAVHAVSARLGSSRPCGAGIAPRAFRNYQPYAEMARAHSDGESAQCVAPNMHRIAQQSAEACCCSSMPSAVRWGTASSTMGCYKGVRVQRSASLCADSGSTTGGLSSRWRCSSAAH